MDRRSFLARASRAAGAAALAPSLQGLVACVSESGRDGDVRTRFGYGSLRAAGDELALPTGFRYALLGVEGQTMSDGRPTPRAHDGMAAFPLPGGHVRLLRNHEDRDPAELATLRGEPALAYDSRAGGAVTALEVAIGPDGTPRLVRDFVALSGTLVNCAGGPTPWGSWLTCEETTAGTRAGYGGEHGYVFEVPSRAEEEVAAQPLIALGRFVHEAVAVDPDTGIVYQTEDQSRAGFYRFLPERRGELRAGGRLEMLAILDAPAADLAVGQEPGVSLPVRWVPIGEPDPPEAATDPQAVYDQGRERGAARFSRLEGCWYGDRRIYFHATDGGDAGCGQVWAYHPGRERIVLVFESPGPEVLDRPDNLTVSPRGGLLLCEDGPGEVQRVCGLTPEGEIFDFAENLVNDREFAGACFAPDGETLFVNIQGDTRSAGPGHPGMTFAIRGPWSRGPL